MHFFPTKKKKKKSTDTRRLLSKYQTLFQYFNLNSHMLKYIFAPTTSKDEMSRPLQNTLMMEPSISIYCNFEKIMH